MYYIHSCCLPLQVIPDANAEQLVLVEMFISINPASSFIITVKQFVLRRPTTVQENNVCVGLSTTIMGANSIYSGVNSISCGVNSISCGVNSISCGVNSISSGANSISSGVNSISSGVNSISSGANSRLVGLTPL